MTTNTQIADVLDEIGDLLEFQGTNAFRIRAYRNGARAIRELPEPISAMAERGDDLTKLAGIGKSVAEKCHELIDTGELKQLVELRKQVPHSVLDLLRVPGMGPKKAAMLFNELKIKDLDELKEACEQGRVRALKGFGEKTEQQILAGIEVAAAANTRMLWADADDVARSLLAHLKAVKSIQRMELAGSYRRGKETVGDLDILVVADDHQPVMDRFGAYEDLATVIGRGETKMSIRLKNGFQVDLRVVPAESFGAALQYFTGSKEHNVVLRGRARQQGLKINEYGIFDVSSGKEVYLGGAEERDIYDQLKLPLFPPEMRENRREFEWAEQGELPRLIELGDIRGDLHMHTTATDGKASLREMIEAARSRGLQYIAITDHSQRVSMARGLDPQRLRDQWAEIDDLNEELDGKFLVLKGIECDILEKGGMDLPDDVLEEADWVLASVHYGQQQSRKQITERILGAVENPHVDCIAHPTGRLVNRREPYEVDLDSVLHAAKEHGKWMELNASPERLDLHDVNCAAAQNLGIPIVISTDAHSVLGLDQMRYGVLQARRGGLRKEDVANTRTAKDFLKLLRSRN
ncbi:MAG: DNA polymerase/3'-5' exonuclease PolX [Planctomycetales bacterium]|nr:DNA polymerase/3'-5' exonuclease PolX [Planctomycetales bacterium]